MRGRTARRSSLRDTVGLSKWSLCRGVMLDGPWKQRVGNWTKAAVYCSRIDLLFDGTFWVCVCALLPSKLRLLLRACLRLMVSLSSCNQHERHVEATACIDVTGLTSATDCTGHIKGGHGRSESVHTTILALARPPLD